MTIEVEVTGGEIPTAASTEAAAAVALAEVAVVAIEATAERVDELAQARAALGARDQELLDMRASFETRFLELEARIADANFVAVSAAEAAEVALEGAIEIADEVEEVEEEIIDELDEEETEAELIAGEEVVSVVPLIEAENPPVLHEEAQQIAAKKKRGFIRI